MVLAETLHLQYENKKLSEENAELRSEQTYYSREMAEMKQMISQLKENLPPSQQPNEQCKTKNDPMIS